MRETTPELTDAIHKDSNKTRRKIWLLGPVVITEWYRFHGYKQDLVNYRISFRSTPTALKFIL